jgi:hypothetical protein
MSEHKPKCPEPIEPKPLAEPDNGPAIPPDKPGI